MGEYHAESGKAFEQRAYREAIEHESGGERAPEDKALRVFEPTAESLRGLPLEILFGVQDERNPEGFDRAQQRLGAFILVQPGATHIGIDHYPAQPKLSHRALRLTSALVARERIDEADADDLLRVPRLHLGNELVVALRVGVRVLTGAKGTLDLHRAVHDRPGDAVRALLLEERIGVTHGERIVRRPGEEEVRVRV